MTTKKGKRKKRGSDALKVGDRVWVAGKPGTVTGLSKDGQRVPWIICDDGENWDARDLGSVYRIPTVHGAAEKVVAYLNQPGANYRSIEWECAIQWLQRAVAEANKARATS